MCSIGFKLPNSIGKKVVAVWTPITFFHNILFHNNMLRAGEAKSSLKFIPKFSRELILLIPSQSQE